jgi:hypothetical protein
MPHTHSQAGLKKRMSKAQYKSKLPMPIFTLKKPCNCEEPLHRLTIMELRTVFLKLKATKRHWSAKY